MDNPCKHPTIILPQEIDFNDLKFIIEFVYRGEIDVSQTELEVSLDDVIPSFALLSLAKTQPRVSRIFDFSRGSNSSKRSVRAMRWFRSRRILKIEASLFGPNKF